MKDNSEGSKDNGRRTGEECELAGRVQVVASAASRLPFEAY